MALKAPALTPTHSLLCRSPGPHPRLRQVKRLRSDCGVELCVIVEVIFDDQVALARGPREPREVEDANFSAGVFDKSFSLEDPGCRRNSGTAPPSISARNSCEILNRSEERRVG